LDVEDGVVPIEQTDDKEERRREEYCLLTESLRVLNADHLPALDLGREGINAPQFGVIHDLLPTFREPTSRIPAGNQEQQNKKTLLGGRETPLQLEVGEKNSGLGGSIRKYNDISFGAGSKQTLSEN
jgi:hypothetical protein